MRVWAAKWHPVGTRQPPPGVSDLASAVSELSGRGGGPALLTRWGSEHFLGSPARLMDELKLGGWAPAEPAGSLLWDKLLPRDGASQVDESPCSAGWRLVPLCFTGLL